LSEHEMTLKDYIAFLIALLTTHLLPLIVIALVILIVAVLISMGLG